MFVCLDAVTSIIRVHLNKEIWFSIMNNIRGQRRWSLLTGTTDGLMMIALNGVPIGEFNVQRFSIKWIRDLGHLRCDDFSHVGQPHSTTEPTTENGVDPAGDGPKVPDVVMTFDHVYDDLGNVHEDPEHQNLGNVYQQPNSQNLGNAYQQPNSQNPGNVYQQPNSQNLGNVYQQPNSQNLGNVYQQPNSQNLGNVYQQPNSQNLGNVYQQPNSQNLGNVDEPVNEDSNGDDVQGSSSVSDSAGVHEDSHRESVEEGSGSIPLSADIEQPPATQDKFQCLKTAYESRKNSGYSFNDELYECNLGLTPENLDTTLHNPDGTPKCKRRRVEPEFQGTPMELMRIEIRELTPYRFNNVEFLRESARLDEKKNDVADMTKKIVPFFPVKQLGDHSFTTEALLGSLGKGLRKR